MKFLRAGWVFAGFSTLVLSVSAQTFTSLYTFDRDNGAYPAAALVQSSDGNLYGTTFSGGVNNCSFGAPEGFGCGAVFQITQGGGLTALYSFCPPSNCSSYFPRAGLIQGSDGNFYGTTEEGGAKDRGTIFKITPEGGLTTLYNFCSQSDCSDGATPYAGLIQASDMDFYGTTKNGGAFKKGAIFKITAAGNFTTLYSFCSLSGCSDGTHPYAALLQATNGNLYGTTEDGGPRMPAPSSKSPTRAA
jgi:uncharacterized repeat protein (TIGR03803 family)